MGEIINFYEAAEILYQNACREAHAKIDELLEQIVFAPKGVTFETACRNLGRGSWEDFDAAKQHLYKNAEGFCLLNELRSLLYRNGVPRDFKEYSPDYAVYLMAKSRVQGYLQFLFTAGPTTSYEQACTLLGQSRRKEYHAALEHLAQYQPMFDDLNRARREMYPQGVPRNFRDITFEDATRRIRDSRLDMLRRECLDLPKNATA